MVFLGTYPIEILTVKRYPPLVFNFEQISINKK